MDQGLVDRIRMILHRASRTVEPVSNGPSSGYFQALHPLAEFLEFFQWNNGNMSVRWSYRPPKDEKLEIELDAEGVILRGGRSTKALLPESFSEAQAAAFLQLLSEIEALLDIIERGMQDHALEVLLKS